MNFELQIHFIGLIAWHFNEDLSGGRALLLRVNDEHPYRFKYRDEERSIPPHFPGLLFGAGECTSGQCPRPSDKFLRSLDLCPRESDSETPFGLPVWGGMDLDHQLVSLKFPGMDDLLLEPASKRRPRDPANRRPVELPDSYAMRKDISFLVDMGQLCLDTQGGNHGLHGGQMLASQCLAGTPDAFPGRLAAAFEMPGGRFEVHRLAEIPPCPGSTKIPACWFGPLRGDDPRPRMRQAVADHMLLTIDEVVDPGGDGLEISIQAKNANETIRLKPAEGDRRIVLLVADRPLGVPCAQVPAPPPDTPAFHFQTFFDLAQGDIRQDFRPAAFPDTRQVVPAAGTNGRMPFVGGLCLKPESGVGRPICPQATFTSLE